jgi:acyl-CoA synthetase (AMP-forming)/AMP-acid ligase II
MNIVEPILFQCRNHPPAPALGAPGTAYPVVSYARLERLINNASRRALSLGLAPGTVVALLIGDAVVHAAIMLGLMRLGIVTVSVSDLSFPTSLKVDAVIADAAVANRADMRVVRLDPSWTMGDGQPIEERSIPHGAGSDLCRIVLSSGSTGEMKAIPFTHDLVLAQIARHNYALGNSFMECSRFFCDFSLPSYICFRLFIYVLSRGGMMMFPGASVMDTVQSFGLYKLQGMIASPVGLTGYLKFYEENPSFQSPFQVIFTGGSAIPKSLSDRLRASLCRNILFVYGATESTTIALLPEHVASDVPGAVGHVTPGVRVEIVDDADRPLPAGSEGRVRIRSPFTVAGYLDNPEETQKSFRDGWFYPGDLGRFTPDGVLVVSGRESDALNIGGVKVRPQAIEEALAGFASVQDAAAFSQPNTYGIEEIWALVVAKQDFDWAALRAHCARVLPGMLVPAQILTVTHIPRNENGKIERHRLRDAAAQAG